MFFFSKALTNIYIYIYYIVLTEQLVEYKKRSSMNAGERAKDEDLDAEAEGNQAYLPVRLLTHPSVRY